MSSIKLTILTAIVFISLTQMGKAQTDSIQSAFVIDSLSVTHGTTPHIGDTVHLIVHARAFVTGGVSLNLHFPGAIAPPVLLLGQTQSDSLMFLDSGSSYSFSIPLKLYGYGGSMVETWISSLAPVSGYENLAYSFADFEFSATSFTASYANSAAARDTVTLTEDDLPLDFGYLDISGKVIYADGSQRDPVTDSPLYKGVYGDSVILAFTKGDARGGDSILNVSELYFPPFGGCIPGINFCKTDVNGHFHFHIPNGPDYWSPYVDAVLLATTSNDATHVIAPVESGPEPEPPPYNLSILTINPSSGCPQTETFNYSGAVAIIPINGSNNIIDDTVKLVLHNPEGSVLRNEEFAREFDSLRPIGAVPRKILSQIFSSLGGYAGDFNLPPYPLAPNGDTLDTVDHVNMDKNGVSAKILDHEYGHYAQWTLQGYNYGSETPTFRAGTYDSTFFNFTEGFADFHSFAVRNYVTTTYGDQLDTGEGNCEEGPFAKNNFATFRTPLSGRVACTIWNIYDGYNDPGFKASLFAGADNDDIGIPGVIFSYLSGDTGKTTLANYMAYLNANEDSAEMSSIQKIDTFIETDTSIKMRPAQVTGLSGSISHCDGFDCEVYKVSLNWMPQEYTSGDYANLPDSIHVYESDDGGTTWYLIETLSPDATSTTYDIINNGADFKVSTYNSSKDAYNAPTVGVSYYDDKKIADGHPDLVSDTAGLDVTVHPNPANSITQICVAELPGGIPASVDVVNEAGEVVATLYNTTPDAELGLCLSLDCSKLPSGTYYAHVSNAIMGRAVKLSVSH